MTNIYKIESSFREYDIISSSEMYMSFMNFH